MPFFSGRGASVTIDGLSATMNEWSLNVDGERIDITSYESPTFDGLVGLVTATISLKGPYPYNNLVGKGYKLFPDKFATIVLYLDAAQTYYWTVLARIEKAGVSTVVQGIATVQIEAVVVENILDGADVTERIEI